MLGLLPIAALALQLPCRRDVCFMGAAAAVFAPPATAYDQLPTQTPDFEAMEKARLERTARMNKNKQEIKPYLTKITNADTVLAFSDAADELTVWMIGKGKMPEGIDAPRVRDVLQDAYTELPQKGYACEMTRTNKGICFSPGEPADSAYDSAIDTLRKFATRKGKGSLMSDGVSAANSAAF